MGPMRGEHSDTRPGTEQPGVPGFPAATFAALQSAASDLFRLELAAVGADAGSICLVTSDVASIATVAPPVALRVLAVDDEPALAAMVVSMLRQIGCSAESVASGEAALAYLTALPVELVVTDLGLGAGMSGWDLAAAVRERWPVTRVLLATGWGARIEPEEARARGADGVLAKPYRVADLQRAIESLYQPHALA